MTDRDSNQKESKEVKETNFRKGFVTGLGWSFGVTVGFVLISTFLVVFLNALGGLPLVGSFIADIVENTQNQLQQRTPLYR